MSDVKRWKLGTVAILVTWLVTIIGAVWAASASLTSVKARAEANYQATVDHEGRLRVIEAEIQQIAADVRWIRRTIEQQQRP